MYNDRKRVPPLPGEIESNDDILFKQYIDLKQLEITLKSLNPCDVEGCIPFLKIVLRQIYVIFNEVPSASILQYNKDAKDPKNEYSRVEMSANEALQNLITDPNDSDLDDLLVSLYTFLSKKQQFLQLNESQKALIERTYPNISPLQITPKSESGTDQSPSYSDTSQSNSPQSPDSKVEIPLPLNAKKYIKS